MSQKNSLHQFSHESVEFIYEALKTSPKGLFADQAEELLDEYGYNEPVRKRKSTVFTQLLSRFFNPLVIVLLFIAGISMYLGSQMSALLVIVMAVMSVFLSFFQEHKAGAEAEKLSEMVKATATVYRDGRAREIKMREIVPGDIVDLFAGDMIPADLRLISCKDLFINQASLTGESFPVEKSSIALTMPVKSTSELSNIAFMGSSVVSGTGLGVVISTGGSAKDVVRGVVVPQMDALVYLGFLGLLGALLACPAGLRRLRGAKEN